MKYLLILALLLVPAQALAQRSVQSQRSRSVVRAPAVRAPAVRAPAAVRVRPPAVRVRPPARVIVPAPRPIVRNNIIVRNGRAIRVPFAAPGSYSQNYTYSQSTTTAPAQSAPVTQYDTQGVDVAALQAENQALREENAYLKGQLNAK